MKNPGVAKVNEGYANINRSAFAVLPSIAVGDIVVTSITRARKIHNEKCQDIILADLEMESSTLRRISMCFTRKISIRLEDLPRIHCSSGPGIHGSKQ